MCERFLKITLRGEIIWQKKKNINLSLVKISNPIKFIRNILNSMYIVLETYHLFQIKINRGSATLYIYIRNAVFY